MSAPTFQKFLHQQKRVALMHEILMPNVSIHWAVLVVNVLLGLMVMDSIAKARVTPMQCIMSHEF